MAQTTGPGLNLADFSAVDTSADPQALVRYLDQAKSQPTLKALWPKLIEQLRLPKPARVLDAGCGLGVEALELARTGDVEVVGVDSSRTMIDEAERRASGTELPVSFQQANAAQLPFPDSSFDACQAQTLLGHVRDPFPVVAELVRVTRPGGRIVILDLDQGSTVLDHPDRAITRTILQALTDSFANGWTGRQLRRLLLQADLQDVAVELTTMQLPAGFLLQLLLPTTRRLQQQAVLADDTFDQWWTQLREMADAGLFTAHITWYLASGTVPG
jgi:ubiquinone/menaquinone biosynthesis C-methylase UbiE